jgi:hypothetical protein
MGHPHTLDKRLAKAAARIARKKSYFDKPMKLIEGGNVTALFPDAPPPPLPPASEPYLSAEPMELVHSEAHLVETANETLAAGFQFCHDVLTDPSAPVSAKFRAMELATKAKSQLTRTLTRSARHDAWSTDTPHMSPAQREGFERQQEAQRLVKAGWTVTTPAGQRITPREQPELIDDDPDPPLTPKQKAAVEDLRRQAERASARWKRIDGERRCGGDVE